MNIGPEKHTVVNAVRPTLPEWLNVNCVQYRQCSLLCHRTPSLIDVSHKNTETTLP